MVMSDTKNGLKDEDKLQCLEKGRFQCGQLCYHFLDICDHRCQCLDCQDEIDCGGGEMSLEATSTPVLKSQKSNGFWRVVKVSLDKIGNLIISKYWFLKYRHGQHIPDSHSTMQGGAVTSIQYSQ